MAVSCKRPGDAVERVKRVRVINAEHGTSDLFNTTKQLACGRTHSTSCKGSGHVA